MDKKFIKHWKGQGTFAVAAASLPPLVLGERTASGGAVPAAEPRVPLPPGGFCWWNRTRSPLRVGLGLLRKLLDEPRQARASPRGDVK